MPIVAGTNDLLMSEKPSDTIADQIVDEVVHARGAKSPVITIPEIFCERTKCRDVKRRRQAVNKHLRMYAAAAGSKAYLSDLHCIFHFISFLLRTARRVGSLLGCT